MNVVEVTEFRLKFYPKDFARSKDFYKTTLGFPILHEWDRGAQDKGVMFKVGSTTLELLSPEAEHRPIAGVGLSLAVPHVAELWQKLKNKAPVVFELRDNPWGDSSFCISDPEGLEVTFFTKTNNE